MLGTKVRTHWVASPVTVVAALSDITNLAIDAFIAMDKIRIIGVSMTNFINTEGVTLDSDVLYLMATLNMTPGILDGVVMLNSSEVSCKQGTVGVNVGVTIIGNTYKHRTEWFPVGHGIDLDPYEGIYLGYFMRNNMGSGVEMSCSAIIYYVER